MQRQSEVTAENQPVVPKGIEPLRTYAAGSGLLSRSKAMQFEALDKTRMKPELDLMGHTNAMHIGAKPEQRQFLLN